MLGKMYREGVFHSPKIRSYGFGKWASQNMCMWRRWGELYVCCCVWLSLRRKQRNNEIPRRGLKNQNLLLLLPRSKCEGINTYAVLGHEAPLNHLLWTICQPIVTSEIPEQRTVGNVGNFCGNAVVKKTLCLISKLEFTKTSWAFVHKPH